MTTTANTTATAALRLSTHISGGDFHRRFIQAVYNGAETVGHVYRSYTTTKWVAVQYLGGGKEKKLTPVDTKDLAVAKLAKALGK